MEASRFSFELPRELIAQHPPAQRGQSRLMLLRAGGRPEHHSFSELPDLLSPGDVAVVNDTRVRRSRLLGRGIPGGRRVEFLLLRSHQDDPRQWQAIARGGSSLVGRTFRFEQGRAARVVSATESQLLLQFDAPLDDAYFEVHGDVPLPPYIDRRPESVDGARYQTVFADRVGSAAAPTAGLHFDEPMLQRLRERGVEIVALTLEVGLGTFSPIRAVNVEDHRMHQERYRLPESTAEAVNAAMTERRAVVAVGTTVVRAIESACDKYGRVAGGTNSTDLFIRPGYRFRVVERLITNFHTPRSSLLVMVSAFAGTERILAAYDEAVGLGYRFFSYGDATLLDRATQ